MGDGSSMTRLTVTVALTTVAALTACERPGPSMDAFGNEEPVQGVHLGMQARDYLSLHTPEDGRQAGYEEVETDRVAVAFAFDSPADYAEFIVAMAGPMRVVADSMSAEERAGMMGALQGAVAGFAAPDGRIHMVNEVLCIAGSRPLQE